MRHRHGGARARCALLPAVLSGEPLADTRIVTALVASSCVIFGIGFMRDARRSIRCLQELESDEAPVVNDPVRHL